MLYKETNKQTTCCLRKQELEGNHWTEGWLTTESLESGSQRWNPYSTTMLGFQVCK